jgi:hypothetical protein
MPTIMARSADNNVVAPDILSLEGKGIEVLAAGWVLDKFRQTPTQLIDQPQLKRILIRTGQAGRSTRTIEYLLKGSGDVTVTYASQKGGTVRKTITLK